MHCQKIFILSLLLTLSAICQAQEPTMRLAGMELRLGMPKETVMEQLRDTTRFIVRQEGESVWLGRKAQTGKPEGGVLGSMSFEDGRLVSASQDWANSTQTAAIEFAKTLFSLLANFNDEEYRLATVNTKITRRTDFTVEEINMAFGNKTVTLFITSQMHDYPPSVQISEGLIDWNAINK